MKFSAAATTRSRFQRAASQPVGTLAAGRTAASGPQLSFSDAVYQLDSESELWGSANLGAKFAALAAQASRSELLDPATSGSRESGAASSGPPQPVRIAQAAATATQPLILFAIEPHQPRGPETTA